MSLDLRNALSNSWFYHWGRMALTGGLPLKQWADIAGMNNPANRIADIGCGPCDMLRVLTAENKPAYYLGIDVSDEYLESAGERARAASLDFDLRALDLYNLASDPTVQESLTALLKEKEINQVILFGVMHHLTDDAVRHTFDILHEVPGIERIITQDVYYIEGATANNKLCDWDRGEHVRTEKAYEELVGSTTWESRETKYSHAGYPFIKYIHYTLSRVS